MKETKKKESKNPASVEDENQFDWSQAEATGFENTSAEDLGIPFLVILQKGSPEVDETHKDHHVKAIEGAKAGCVINTVSREIYYSPKGEPLFVIPCGYEKLFVEWKPKNEGGGFVKAHRDPMVLTRTRRNDKNQDINEAGNMIVQTGYFYVLVLLPDQDPVKVVIGMSSTQLKKARGWLNIMQSIKLTKPDGSKFTPPMFSHQYALTTLAETNEKGSWFGWKIESAGILKDKKLIEFSSETAKQVLSGSRLLLAPPNTDEEKKNIPF